MEKKLNSDWKKLNAGYFFKIGIKIEEKISGEKNRDKIIDEFKNIIDKIVTSDTEERMLKYVINSIFVIESLISKTTLKSEFREEIIMEFFEKNGIDMITPSRSDTFNPEFHTVVGGKKGTYQIENLKTPGFKEKSGKVIKKTLVILE